MTNYEERRGASLYPKKDHVLVRELVWPWSPVIYYTKKGFSPARFNECLQEGRIKSVFAGFYTHNSRTYLLTKTQKLYETNLIRLHDPLNNLNGSLHINNDPLLLRPIHPLEIVLGLP